MIYVYISLVVALVFFTGYSVGYAVRDSERKAR